MEDKPAIPERGRYRLKYRGTECLNCGHPLVMSDKFCPNCSQANSTKKLSLTDFLDEFFASFISYDSKLLKTLSALLLRPGKITRDYINGKRVSYTNPFRFLLSLSIIYFLMINFTGNFSKWDKYGKKDNKGLTENFNDWQSSFSDESGAELNQQLDSLKNVVDYEKFLAEIKIRDSVILSNPEAHFKTIEKGKFGDRWSQKQEFFLLALRKDSIYDFEDAKKKYRLNESIENKWVFNASDGLLHLKREPGSFVSKLISKLPFAIFFFLPVFALFIWLAYIRKKHNYTDHLVFGFHNTSLLFILLIISYLIDSIFNLSLNWLFLIIFSVYLFQAMRKFYNQGIFKTSVKYVFLNTIFFILALFSTLILFAGNVFTF